MGRVALVTGSTDGIGRQVARRLAEFGLRVIVHGRSKEKVDATLEALRGELPGAELDGVAFDLGTLAGVRRGVEQLGNQAVNVLVNNAGIFANERVITSEGFELTLAVNHLGPFLLTELLADRLDRVVNVASVAHTRGRMHFDDLTLAQGYTGYAAYAQSKLANVMHAMSLHEHHGSLTAYSVHPGVVATKLLRAGFGPVQGVPPEQGARTITRLASAATLEEPTGAYFSDGAEIPPAAAARNDDAREQLWQVSKRLCQ
jgi:NAD(P)-dependent dehydrogenase (short-subunit alcohol dehydrogenase family)